MERYGDFTRPFRRVAPLLRGFDLTVANLEGNLSATLPQPENDHSFSFVSNPAMLEGFALAEIDAVTLANNHTVWNDEGWGVQGLLDTMAALEDAGLPYFGAGYDLTGARAPWRTTVAARPSPGSASTG
jgi:poly-gamma-glutamate synthesis protein (capsule biosynthesis protein)